MLFPSNFYLLSRFWCTLLCQGGRTWLACLMNYAIMKRIVKKKRHMLMIFCIYLSISSKLSDYRCFIFLPLKWIKYLLIIVLWIGFLGLCSNRCNLGYAFVNFTTTGAALRLYKLLHKLKWEAFCSKKVCEITYARLQVQHLISYYFGVYNIYLEYLCSWPWWAGQGKSSGTFQSLHLPLRLGWLSSRRLLPTEGWICFLPRA